MFIVEDCDNYRIEGYPDISFLNYTEEFEFDSIEESEYEINGINHQSFIYEQNFYKKVFYLFMC